MLLKVTGVTAHYRQGAVTRATRSDFEALARRKRKSPEKLGRREPLSTGTLQLGDKEGAFSAGNEHAAWVYVQHFTRYPSREAAFHEQGGTVDASPPVEQILRWLQKRFH